ncbi:MAG: hypothetical protein ACIAQU_12510 [Phycisphaerales bacterium JB064]
MFWQWIQNNLGIIIVALSFGVSGLGWLLQKLKEAHEKKQADELRKRARMEALRTGRFEGQPSAPGGQTPAPAQAETPRQRLEELAKRRQQEQAQRTAAQRHDLEEQLRRRREAIEAQRRQQQQGRTRQAPPPPPRQAPAQRSPKPAQRPQQRPQPVQQRPSQPARRPGERRPAAPLPTMQPTERPVQETVISDVIEAKRRQEAQPIEAPLPVGGVRRSGSLVAMGIDLRQAVIMREIFDKPVGMRQPDHLQF